MSAHRVSALVGCLDHQTAENNRQLSKSQGIFDASAAIQICYNNLLHEG